VHWAEEGIPSPELYVPATHCAHKPDARFTAVLYVPAPQLAHVASAVDVHTEAT